MTFNPETAVLSEPVKKSFNPSTAKLSNEMVEPNQPEGSILNAIANAATFGWGDEITSNLLGVYGVASGDIPPNQMDTAIKEIREGIEVDRKAYAEANPGKSMAAEIGTMAVVGLPKVVQTLATKGLMGAGAVAGLEGLVYGAGEGGEGYKEGETIVDLPMIDPIQAPIDIPGRVSGGVGMGLAAVPMGIGGAKAMDMVTSGLANKAAQKQMVRQGVESPDTAGLVMKDPSQKQVPETLDTGDIIEDTITALPKKPQGMEILTELSPLQPSVVTSKSGEKALYQKVSPKTLTNIREANPATRKQIEKITKIHWGKLNNTTDIDPFLVIGDEFSKRLNKVKESQNKALDIQKTARNDLRKIKGAELSSSIDDIAENLSESFQNKLISINDEGGLDFDSVGAASPLKKGSNRKALSNVWNQFKSAKNADDLHVLRRDIDKMIKFEKGGVSGGVDDDTSEILKGLRSSIRENLNNLSADYAEGNRIMSQNLDAFSKLESSMPRLKKLDLNNADDLNTATNYIGQQLRKLDSNYANEAELSSAVDLFDSLASEYGGQYPVDIKRLSKHLAEIKLRLGEGKSSGFQDKIEAGTRRGTSPVNKKGFVEQKIMDVLNPVKGISDEQAYEAIIENISEMNKRERAK